jgi:hypothetical protein
MSVDKPLPSTPASFGRHGDAGKRRSTSLVNLALVDKVMLLRQVALVECWINSEPIHGETQFTDFEWRCI